MSSNEALAKELIASMTSLAEKLGQKSLGGVDGGALRSREGDGGQFMQKFTAVQALAAPGKEEALQHIGSKFEKILNRTSPGPELRDALLEGIEKLKKALLRSASGSSVGIRPKALGASTSATKLVGDSPSPQPLQQQPSPASMPKTLLLPVQQRGRSSSLHIPKSLVKPEKTPDPIASPTSSPRGHSSNSVLSPRNSMNIASPRGVRQVTFPVSLRWSVLNSIRTPGMSVADAESAIASFFDGVNDLINEGVIVPSSSSKVKPHQKSPRTNKAPSKKHESSMANLFGPLEPVLRTNSWMEVFHARLGITQTLASGQLLDGLTELCNVILSKGATDAITESVAKRVSSLKRFLDTFVIDVDSAVVGLEVQECFAPSFACLVEMDLACVDEDVAVVNLGNSGGSISLSSGSPAHVPLDAEILREKVLLMAEMQSPELVMSLLAELALRLKQDNFRTFRVGDIGVVKLHGKFVYVRVIRKDKQSGALLVSAGLAFPKFSVRREMQIRPLSSEMRKLIERGQIGQVVVDWHARIKKSLSKLARSHVVDSLGIVFSYPEEWERGKALINALPAAGNVADLDLLRKLETDASLLVGNPLLADATVLSRLGEMFAARLETLTVDHFSGKGRDAAVGRVVGLGLTVHQMVNVELGLLTEALVARVKTLEKECEDVLSGTRKHRMTVEWLSMVREEVGSLLEDHGFDATASNHDYISVPPSNIGAIRQNLRILQHLLREVDGEVAALSKRLCAKVYPVCDRFIEEAVTVCLLLLGCGLPKRDSDLIEQLQVVVRRKQERAVAFDERILGVLEDLLYLKEMRRLEEHPLEKSQHIVPVSGLVVSSIVRKEKEMATVLEVWGNKN